MRGVVGAVVRREYLQRVRSKWFVIGTLAAPILALGVMALPILLASQGVERDQRYLVVDHTGVLHEGVVEGLEEAGYQVEVAHGEEAEEEGRARVRTGALGGMLVLDGATLERGAARLVGDRRPSIIRQVAIRQVVSQSALEVRLGSDAGLDALLAGGELDFEGVTDQASGFDDAAFAVSFIGAFILYMTILMHAVAVMRSVLEEKTNRVVEVVISAMRPSQLMLGKILGVGAVGLTQLAIWVASGAVIVAAGIPALAALAPEVGALADIREYLPGVGLIALFVIFFLGGYFMHSGLYAAVGAMCSTDEEAQQAQLPVTILLVVPVVFLSQVIADPGGAFPVALSLIPFFTPILMFARAAVGVVPVWQLALSVAGMAAAVVFIAWLAGRIYKVGILMTGKRPTLPELLRWVREA